MKKTKLKEVALCRDCGDTHDCQSCRGRGYHEGGVIYDAAGGQMDYVEPQQCVTCHGTGKCPWCPEEEHAA